MFSNMERKKSQQNSFFEMSLSSGGRFIEREGVSTLSIRGYPRALMYLLLCFHNLFAFQVCVGFEKVSFEKILRNSCICPPECMKNLFDYFLKVSERHVVVVVLKRAGT